MIFKIIVIIIPLICLSQIAANFDKQSAFENGIGPLFPETSKELKVKFSNQEIQLKNFENAQIIKSNGSIFLLNGIDLFALNIQNNSDEKRNLKKIGQIDGIDGHTVSEIKASSWSGYEIFVVALDSYYNVYVVKNEESTNVLAPIEKLMKQGSKTKIDFFQFNRELYCVILNVMSDRERGSILYIYKWRKSHFTLLEEISIQAVDDLFMYSTETTAIIETINYFNSSMKEAGNTVLNVYVFTDGNSLRHIQTLYLDSVKIFPITFNDVFYFYAVSYTGLLTSYQWDTDNFVKWLDYKEIKNITNFVSSETLIIAQVNDELLAYTNSKLSSTHKISSINSKDLSEIFPMNFNGRSYIALVNKNFDELRIKLLEAEIEDEQKLGESIDLDRNCFTTLRDLQRANVLFIEYIKNMIPSFYYKDQEVRTEIPTLIKTLSVARKADIGRININIDLKISIKQLKDKIEMLRLKIETLKNKTSRHKRDLKNSSTDSLEANTITVKRLNIPNEMFQNILVKSNGKAVYKGKLTTKTLKANSIKLQRPSETILGSILPNEHTKVDGMHTIRNLQVKTVNGISWNDFHRSLYLRDSPQPIDGNLIVTNLCHVKHLSIQSINELPVNTFVTLNTDQTISSDIFIPTFHSVRIEANSINGVDFKNDVARLHEDNVIETPVKILHAHIGDLTLANSEDDKMIARHIGGTKVEDLSQIYNGKVVIKGSLKLRNVILDSPKSNIFVDEQQFRLNVAEYYWMKTVDQQIGNVKFSSLISAPQLLTESINNIPTAELVITNVTPKQQVNFVLEKVYVKGNVYTDPEFETSLQGINKQCVSRGSSTTISGTKIFTGLLSVNDFSGQFDDYPTTEIFVLNNENEKNFFLDCTKKFESIVINGNLEFGGDQLIVNSLKGVNLLEFFQNASRINEPTRLETLTFHSLKASNLTVNRINGLSFNQIVAALENSLGQKGNLKSVRVNGTVIVLENLLVNTINDINFDHYLGLVVTKKSGGQIGGIKRFLSGLSVSSLNVRRVNSVDFVYWFENALHKHSEQVIGQNWTLTSISVGEMNAYMINGIRTKEIIDVTADVIDIRSDIRAKSIDVRKNMNGLMPCDVKDLDYVLKNSPTKSNWNFIDVNGYVGWRLDNVSPINEIMKYAMTGYDQVITGDTYFENVTFINNCQSSGFINNINLTHIFQDSLLKQSQLQMIKESIIFKQPIQVGNLQAEKDLQSPFINDVDVVNLNNSIFRISDSNIISGTKIFHKPPRIDRMILDGTINGAQINDIFFANPATIVPPIYFHYPITIQQHFTIGNEINGINYNYLIEHIIRKTGPPQEITGAITFQHLILQGDTKIPFINGVDINDIVLKTSDSIQEILDHKTIIGDIFLDGPAVITNINGLEVVDAYSNSIFLDKNMIIRRLEVMGDVIVHKGFTVNSYMNSMPISPLVNWQLPTKTELIPIWSNVLNKINEVEQLLNQNYGKSFHILHLDYASDVKIKFEANSIPISFIVDTVHTGEQCGLEHKCDCPAQCDISLSPFRQIHINRRPYFNRMLKMLGSNCNITVITNFTSNCVSNVATQTLTEWSAGSGSGILTFNEAIFGVKLFEVGPESFLLINHFNGSTSALKLDQRANNWFKSDQINGYNIHLDVLEWKSFKVLIAFSKTNEIMHHPVARLFFYNTDKGREGFQMFQEISGEYNLCSKIYMKDVDKYVLFLSKTESQFISIFIVHWGAQFQFFQTLALDAGIKTFVAFRVDDSYCLAIVTTTGYLHIYTHNNIEGWIPIVYGFFTEIESVVPFKYFNQIYLFVSMKNSATVIRVYSQGLY